MVSGTDGPARLEAGGSTSKDAERSGKSVDALSVYRWNRRNTTPFTAWIRAVTAAIPERFCSKTAYLYVSTHWLRPQCSRAPENWRFECPPTLETGCAPLWESNNKHRANTRRESNSESVEVCRTPRGKNNSGSPNTTEHRSTGGLALPAVPPASVRDPHTDSHRAVGRWNYKPETPNPAVRCRGIPPRSRGGGCQISSASVLIAPSNGSSSASARSSLRASAYSRTSGSVPLGRASTHASP